MKRKRIAALALTLALGAGMAVPAGAASQQAAEAVAALEQVAASASSSEMGTPFASYFYLDMDGNGTPELVLVYGPQEDWMNPSGMEIEIWYYDGTAAKRLADGFPAADMGGYFLDSLASSVGASGGSGGALVRFSDGTYGVKSWAFGSLASGNEADDRLTARFSGGRLVPTSEEGEEIYRLFSDAAIPGVYQYFEAPAAPVPMAYASTQTVLVDGAAVEFQAYALRDEAGNETNYVKLRDVAFVLSGTPAQFEVSWDGAIHVETGKAYTPNGSEMSTPFSGDRAYTLSDAGTWIDGSGVQLGAIVLTDDQGGAYTYYKLRDLGTALGFTVGWTAETGITINTQ